MFPHQGAGLSQVELMRQPNAAECPPVPQHTGHRAHQGGEGGVSGVGLGWTELLWGKREGEGNFCLHSKLLG